CLCLLSLLAAVCFFFFYWFVLYRVLHSFPTRRSSDLSVFTAMVLWTAFGSVFALLLGYSRIPYAAARDGYFFNTFARLHPTQNLDRKSTRLNSSHEWISYAVFCLKKKKPHHRDGSHLA